MQQKGDVAHAYIGTRYIAAHVRCTKLFFTVIWTSLPAPSDLFLLNWFECFDCSHHSP